MRKIETLDELKSIGMRGLITFDAFCRKHGLKYSLAAGTMLGAVRHQGFIPWDDDIDLYMNRNEYDKLVQLIKCGERLEDEDYEVCIPDTDGYIYPFIKIVNNKTVVFQKDVLDKYTIGVWIDVFPLDNCGDSFEEAKKVYLYMGYYCRRLLQTIRRFEGGDFLSFLKNVYVWGLRNIFSGNYTKYKNKLISYAFPEGGKYKGQLMWPYMAKKDFCDIYLTEYFEDYTEIEFEGKMFMVFLAYKDILARRYGDYMKIPPLDEQIGHESRAYYID